jgi:hypothetical protein
LFVTNELLVPVSSTTKKFRRIALFFS